jgi:hypothetical protein
MNKVNLIKNYIIQIALIQFPFLNLPGIKQIFTYMLGRILDKIETEGKIFISFSLIDANVNKQVKEYEEALERFKKGEINESNLDEVKNKLRDLVKFP